MAPLGHPSEVPHPARSPHVRSSLLLLLIAEAPRHGYELMERLAGLGFDRDPGGLYRSLRSMEREGLVRSEWELSESGPGRRRYHITALGYQRLELDAGVLEQTRQVVELYLERYRTLQVSSGEVDARPSAR